MDKEEKNILQPRKSKRSIQRIYRRPAQEANRSTVTPPLPLTTPVTASETLSPQTMSTNLQTGFKKRHNGVDIACGSDKMIRREEVGDYLIDGLRGLINQRGSKYTYIRDLEREMEKVLSNDRIKGREPKMYIVLNGGDFKYFKNQTRGTKSFLEWLQESERSDNYWINMAGLRKNYVRLGALVSRTAIDIMFILAAETDVKIGKLMFIENVLHWVSKDQPSLVISMVLQILRMAHRKLNIQQKLMKPLPQDSVTREYLQIKEPTSKYHITEHLIDGLIFWWLQQVFRLELCWMHRGLSGEKNSLNDQLVLLKAEVVDCFSLIKEVQFRMQIAFFMSEDDFRDMRSTDLYRNVITRSNKLWEVLFYFDKADWLEKFPRM